MLEAGDDAPAFDLPNQHGDPVSLPDVSASRTVLYFFPRADTPGCTAEACEFRDVSEEFDAHDVAVVGVSDDSVEDLLSFAEDHDLPFHLLSDESGEVAASYDSYGEKRMFGNTFDGVFRNTYLIGSDGTIELAYEGVSPEGHAERILDDLGSR